MLRGKSTFSLVTPLLSSSNVYFHSAKSTSTGGPFLFSPLRKVVPENNHARLIELLNEYLSSDDISLMERAQFNLQKKWLEDPYCTAAEAEVMFANLPGAAGLPLPDGSMSLWLPTAHLVSGEYTNQVPC